MGRFVPFVAIMAANMVNIPLMRSEELKHGIPVTDGDGNKLGDELSKVQLLEANAISHLVEFISTVLGVLSTHSTLFIISQNAAKTGVAKVVLSRILIAFPILGNCLLLHFVSIGRCRL